jgi:hypothetical protein
MATAKTTKTAATPAKSTDNGGIDLAKLTPEQLQALQKQLKEKRKETVGKRDERFLIIDTMLKEKAEDGKGFRWTTRDICNRLAENNLVDQTEPKWDQNEIKKIQARKQHLEKLTNEKGALVHPKGTFGYKASAQGFNLTNTRIVEWFGKDENIESLTGDQRTTILKALS